jgi:hypothetical protein
MYRLFTFGVRVTISHRYYATELFVVAQLGFVPQPNLHGYRALVLHGCYVVALLLRFRRLG